jgi:mannobiose 2-epimerase
VVTDAAPTRLPVDQSWPLAGSNPFARTPAEWRSTLAGRLRTGLVRHVIGPWFPRSIDHKDGGFLADFDHRWQPSGPQHRMLEFQARQTRTAARLGVALPTDRSWGEVVNHGVRYLADVMRDETDGGWFGLVDRSGQPLLAGTKHAHGTAYLISCGVEAHMLTGDKEPLAIAQAAFEWLEATLHDAQHGGYYGWATRDGRVILGRADLPPELAARDDDPLGHGIGLKDANVHSDLLDAFTLLSGVWPDDRLVARLAEIYDIVTSRFVTSAGAVHYLVERDLTPVPGVERYGYPFQTGFRLAAAARRAGRSVADAQALARRMLDHGIEWAWDEKRGGFVEAGPAAEPRTLAGTRLTLRNRPWWVQAEAAKLLLLVALDEPSPGPRHALFERLVGVIEAEFVDRVRGGWEMTARSDWPLRRRLPWRGMPKSDPWKDASHEADMYLATIRMLRGLPTSAPID